MIDAIDKQQLKKNEQVNTLFQTIFGNNLSNNWEFTASEIELMMLDSDILTGINQRETAINSRLLKIKGDKVDFLQSQFDNMNKREMIRVVFYSKFKGYTVQEIIYNDDLTMKELKEKPNEWYMLQYDEPTKSYKWNLTYSGSSINLGNQIPELKYLIPINRPTDLFLMGRSELEPIYKWWKIKEDALTYAQAIVEKYGGLIWWAIASSSATATQRQEIVDGIRELASDSVMVIPEKPGGQVQGLGHEFGYIPTSDMQIESVHMAIIKFCKDQISQYLIGSSINMTAGESGSYSSANAGLTLLDSIVDADIEYCEYWLDWLIYYQSLIFGFNAKDYHCKLIEKENITRKEQINSLKLDNYKKIKEVGYTVTREFVAEQLGIPIEALEIAVVNTPLQFEKKKSIEDLKEKDRLIDEQLQKVIAKISPKITGQIADQYKESYSTGIKTKSDFDTVITDFSKTELDEYLLLFKLFGMYTQIPNGNIQFAEQYTIKELFDLPFEEAIKFFGDKMPSMYEDIDELTQESIDKTFWIKKATDIEVTNKVKTALDKSLALGGTIKSFIDDIDGTLKKSGIDRDGYYIENVFRTNVMSSYNAGRYEQQEKTKESFPYWLYNAINDDRTSEICKNLDNKVFRADNPIWDTIYPIKHYGCRTIVTALSEEQLYEYNIDTTINQEEVNKAVTNIIKSGFGGSPKNEVKTLKKIATDKEKEVESNNLEWYENAKSKKIIKSAIENQYITDVQRKDLANSYLKQTGSDLKCNIKFMNESSGYNTINRNSRNKVEWTEYALSIMDNRPYNYKIKTIFHELAHNKRSGLEGTDIINKSFLDKNNLKYEEMYAETVAHYLTKKAGINETIMPAYQGYISQILPALKKYDARFEKAVSMYDFGEILYKEHYVKNSLDYTLLKDAVNKDFRRVKNEYIKEYKEFIKSNSEKVENTIIEQIQTEEKRPDIKLDIENILNGKNVDDNNLDYILSACFAIEGVK